jgi:hypothetical protein
MPWIHFPQDFFGVAVPMTKSKYQLGLSPVFTGVFVVVFWIKIYLSKQFEHFFLLAMLNILCQGIIDRLSLGLFATKFKRFI